MDRVFRGRCSLHWFFCTIALHSLLAPRTSTDRSAVNLRDITLYVRWNCWLRFVPSASVENNFKIQKCPISSTENTKRFWKCSLVWYSLPLKIKPIPISYGSTKVFLIIRETYEEREGDRKRDERDLGFSHTEMRFLSLN